MTRRTLLAAIPGLAAATAFADDGLPEIAAYERQSGGRVGLYAKNLESGATLKWRANERFVMCSTFKASLAAFALARADRGEDRMDRMLPYSETDLLEYAPVARSNLARGAMSISEMCAAIVELSDNTCANVLMKHVGGPSALAAFWRSLGDGVSRLDHYEPELNRSPPGDPDDTTMPAAMAGSLRRLVVEDVLSPSSRRQLSGWMINCKTGANRLRAGLPTSWIIGDKTGNNGKDAMGDIAVAWPKPGAPILISVYTQGGSPSPVQVESLFAAIGRTVTSRLS